ncbi:MULTISPECIES: calcium-binding protein [unclassified Microcoleus]|jgi:Ca2+-binding RTX toxin-like protein|uniref:calcium-binding protein n=1 Tax=unclassified Microcoleus TaxID=2642155 RepID=UPI001D7309CC|nr:MULTISPECIES: calcium-binding protein [unclassified Microcoleus]MCC3591516.1 calcium-binding protein [Microcoleus sp. PH2017_28_MFU_U_A]MCC3600632.1 calcium-binding protein [Microcoleus sp. PH2017_26_ELK_O_A]MCC3625766.1 calcium-binding protein [Microcoleus sp. PH2017_36_ELK_O_B]
MALQPDPSEPRRLIGDNTSENVFLSIADTNNFPLGVWMLEGDDTVNISAANNLVYGNEGEDVLRGNSGNDSLFGGRGKDLLGGEAGNDYLSGGQDADLIYGFGGNDILLGGRGNDFLVSGNGYDTLIGGLGRDILLGFDDNISGPKIGSNLYVLQAEPGVTDINNADLISLFRVGFDRIGLAGGLTAGDVVLENLTNVTIILGFDGPQVLKDQGLTSLLNPGPIVTTGTLIKVKNSGNILGFVDGVTPAQVQGNIISVPGF